MTDQPVSNQGDALSASDEASRNYVLFILGAEFSRACGLPLADELWREVRKRAESMDGRAEHFKRDLDYYIAF